MKSFFLKLYNKFFPTLQSKRVCLWRKKGGENLRYEYDLDENSLVVDLGGYKGDWSSDIFSRYCPVTMIFEPIGEYADNIRKRFSKNKKILVFNYGLSNKNTEINLGLSDDSTSQFKSGNHTEKIRLVRASDFLKDNKVAGVDLMKINIEGGEYDLLDHLIASGLVLKIRNIQVQFHDFVPNAKERMEKIKKQLRETHHATYEYEFVWENWNRN